MADTDEAGNLLNPEIIPEFEQRLTAAAATGSNDEVAFVQWEYDNARKDLVSRREAFEAARSESQDKSDPAARPQDTEPTGTPPVNTGSVR